MKTSIIKKSLIVIFWLGVWTALALLISNSIVMAGPFEVIKAFFLNMLEADYLRTIFGSLIRIALGFLCSFAVAFFLGCLSYRFKIVKELLEPLVVTLKSVPVASFVVLLLLWAGAENLSFYISLLIVFPGIYVSTIAGLESTDPRMLKMASTFSFSFRDKCLFIYKDALKGHILSSLKVTLGMAWKSGVAAEVIGLPNYSLGSKIYLSKLYLDTPNLLAWTLTVVLLSFLFEKLVLFIAGIILNHKFTVHFKGKSVSLSDDKDIQINDISVSFGEKEVLSHLDIELKKGKRYALMGPSGIGKTTLLDELEKRANVKVSRAFQEDCLLEEYDGLTNVMIATNVQKEECMIKMLDLLPEECLSRPVSEYSGGMKKRVAIVRAMLCASKVVLLDEPFAGLDEDMKAKAVKFILGNAEGRILVVATHDSEDVEALGGEVIAL